MNLQKPRGTRDFIPKKMHERNYVSEQMTSVFKKSNYQQIGFPAIELAELFEVKSGEEIEGHMYVFEDKGGRKICLRPEATASVARMYVESLRDMKKPLKLYYFCPMYRYERPQKGRYREFWQIGVELIGPKTVESDAEIISLACKSLKTLGLDYKLEIGHLGILRGVMNELKIDDTTQDKIILYLDKEDDGALKGLVKDKVILELIKLKGEKDVFDKAEKLLKDYKKAYTSLMELKEISSLVDSQYSINLGIARGLEYYTGMVFEIRCEGLGAENQICGGGRYDNLIKLFNGPTTPAVGFAFGFDRVMNALEQKGIKLPTREVDILIAPVNKEMRVKAGELAAMLREKFVVDVDLMDRKLGKILEYGSEIKARYALIIGPDDLAKNQVTLRDMQSGEQKKIEIKKIKKEIK